MKILHTADWHIGKKLHKHELSRDFDLFLEILDKTLKEQHIDLLLVSGDVFDLANPSSEARTQYYRTLIRLKQTGCKIIITGGNHDSPAMLNAPKEILKELDIHIIGGLPENRAELLIPVLNKEGIPQLIVAALPYLREADLRTSAQGTDYESRLKAIREGIEQEFNAAAKACQKKYPGVPAIAMGHLFAAGIETSESERDIQIGNQAAFQASAFGNFFNYIALGHIHKPQQVTAVKPTFYSGSPLPLSFSERKDEKRLLLIDTNESWQPQNLPLPSFRKLLKISGNLQTIHSKLKNLEASGKLPTLIEVDLIEENYDALKIYELDQLVTGFSRPGFEIVKHRAHFQNQLSGSAEVFEQNIQLEDLQPSEVFKKILEKHEYSAENKQELLSAFTEILEQAQQEQETN